MFIRKAAILGVMAACLLAVGAVGATPASAVLCEHPACPTPLPIGTKIVADAHSTSFTFTGLGTISCSAGSTTETIHTNHTFLAITTVNSLTFSSCTDTIPVITFTECALRSGTLPLVRLIPTTTNAGTASVSDLIVRCFISAATTGHSSGCDYTAATASGTTSNVPSVISFSGVAVSHVTGTSGDLGSLCGGSATFATKLTHLRTDGAPTTVTNAP